MQSEDDKADAHRKVARLQGYEKTIERIQGERCDLTPRVRPRDHFDDKTTAHDESVA